MAENLVKKERAVIIGVILRGQNANQIDGYLDEMEFLASTVGAVSVKRFVQKLDQAHPATYLGKGKIEEIGDYIENHEIDLVIIDGDLTGKQNSILEETLKRKIIDRSTLILDIFAKRARTAQSRTQVELAQLQYLLPRLRGLWTHLERQRGGIGMRGPGEKEIETDRRIIRDKISQLKKKLEKIDKQQAVRRKSRQGMIRVSLVGYTNAGKSTIMNVISKSDVFAENKLFATLDTTVRKVVFDRMPFLLSDTVGFIRKLPHHLIESFKSTLDEVIESDILLHIVDISNPQYGEHIEVVENTLKDLGASDIPSLLICNKIDAFRKNQYDDFLDQKTKDHIEAELKKNLENTFAKEVIFLSATTKENISTLKGILKERVTSLYKIKYPYQASKW